MDDLPIKPDPAGALICAKKMNCSVKKTIFCGDSSVDIETGLKAGMLSAGVSWGIRPARELLDAGAHILVHKPDNLLHYL